MKRLNIIGCGKVGRVFGKLWGETSTFQIAGVVNRTLASAQEAVCFLGSGTAFGTLDDLPPADITMIATDDSSVALLAEKLRLTRAAPNGALVFHCSGALSSSILRAHGNPSWRVSSVHPVRSFADPLLALQSFHGTYCGLEIARTEATLGGDDCDDVRLILESALKAIGAIVFPLSSAGKPAYHAGIVMACNYFVTLMDSAFQALGVAGVSRADSTAFLAPLLQSTIENVMMLGPTNALTGPIARGDTQVVQSHLDALASAPKSVQEVYRFLGARTLELAALRGDADPQALAEISEILTSGQVVTS